MKKKFRITERDIKILKYLNEFGFSVTKLIQKAIFYNQSLRGGYVSARNRISVLNKLGLIKIHDNIFCKEQVLGLTSFGANFVQNLGGNKMEVIKNLNDKELTHDFKIQNVYLRFRNLGYSNFLSERKIKDQNLFNKLQPDLVMIKNDNKAVMIEIELTQKSKSRIDKILTNYSNNQYTNMLLYICSKEAIKNAVSGRAKKLDLLESKFLAVTYDEFQDPKFEMTLRKIMDSSNEQ